MNIIGYGGIAERGVFLFCPLQEKEQFGENPGSTGPNGTTKEAQSTKVQGNLLFRRLKAC